MPSCIIEGCPNKTGHALSPKGVVLHVFPNDCTAVRRWLESTGQAFNDMDGMVAKIIEGKAIDLFRMCSAHFTSESYHYKGSRKVLKRDSAPTIFPTVPNGTLIDEEWVLTSGKKRPLPKEAPSETLCHRCQLSITQSTKIFKESGTQTNLLDLFDQSQQQASARPLFVEHVEHPYFQTLWAPLKDTRGLTQGPPTIAPSFPKNPIIIIGPPKYTLPSSSGIQVQICNQPIVGGNTPVHVSPGTAKDSEGVAFDTRTFQKPPGEEECNPHDIIVKDSEICSIAQPEEEITPEPFDPDSDPLPKYTKMRKFLVFESCLDELLTKVKCQDNQACQKRVVKINKQLKGSAVIVRGVCEDGHRFKIFESQPKIKQYYAGNILLAASITCSGLNFLKMANFFDVFGLKHISKNTFHHYKRKFCFPAIYNTWEMEQKSVLQEISKRPVVIGGHGQSNSPGHRAKSCVYTFMDLISDKIIDFEVVHTTQCSSSVEMQKFGFEQCMSRALENGLDILHFASDRHLGIRKCMREKYPNINHQLGVWHFAKSISKKLQEASNKKAFAPLKEWVDKIINHFWWCVKNCRNNEEKLRKSWLSVIHHVINEHEWFENGTIRTCAHFPLTDSQEDNRNWLHAGTSVYQKLNSIVNNKDVLSDLKHLTWFCHTGPLEEFHSKVLKCRAKRIHIGKDNLQARTILAALSYNYNTTRTKAVVQKKPCLSGELGCKRVKCGAPNQRHKSVPSSVYETDFLQDILLETLRLCDGTVTSSWVSKSASHSSNNSTLPRRHTAELLSQRKSHFGTLS